MGSSARKKKEKKKDFQKTKLKVGKTKAKADNFTDTSFKSKSIVVNQQSLTTAPLATHVQFAHYLSLASTSRTDTQRKDALAYLTTQLASGPVESPIPLPTAVILPKLLPLILDGNSGVRTQLLKLLKLLPASDIADRAEAALLYIRAGMTHLAAEIRLDALSVLEWLIETAQEEVVACPGGWMKTLKSFVSMLGWASVSGTNKWTATSRASFNSGKATKTFPRQLLVLSQFLKVGLVPADTDGIALVARAAKFPVWDMDCHMIPSRSNAYAHLNLFRSARDEEGEMYIDREDRQRAFARRFGATVYKGVENAKKEGGEVGRAAKILEKILEKGMSDFDGVDGDDTL